MHNLTLYFTFILLILPYLLHSTVNSECHKVVWYPEKKATFDVPKH